MAEWSSYRIAKFGEPLELQTEGVPEPKGEEVLVRVAGCGVCHSDVHIWDGYFDLGGGRKAQVGQGEKSLPLTPGHEIVGEVAALGPDAKGVKVGDKRVVYPWIGCGRPECPECSRGEEHMCSKRSLGVFRDGGYSTHVLVPHARYLLDYDGLPTALAATYACSGLTAYGALRKVGKLGPNDKLLIIGAGGVGMAGVRLAKAVTGVAPIVADIDPAKRQAALENGAVEAIDPGGQGAVKEFVKATGGGVAAAVDFVGAEATVRFGTSALRKSGKLVIVGLFGGALQMPIPFFPFLGIAIQGSQVGSLEELKELIALGKRGLVGAIPLATRPLAEAGATLSDLKAGHIVGRVVLTP
jgi:D-arabinose 1-dehydrogenase-like Zn-dependent alcohol dehydrogenase